MHWCWKCLGGYWIAKIFYHVSKIKKKSRMTISEYQNKNAIKTHNICQNNIKHFSFLNVFFFIFDFYRKSKRFQIFCFLFSNQSQRTMRLAWTDDVPLRPERAGHSKGWWPDLRLPHVRRRTKRGNRLRPGNVSYF